MQCACVLLFSVASLALVYFYTKSYKSLDFQKKKKLTECKMCFDFLYSFSEKCLILRITERDMIKSVHRSSCKVPVILTRF
jgi:hypothetical protein